MLFLRVIIAMETPMKRAYFLCFFLCLITSFLLSQGNLVPLTSQGAPVATPTNVSQVDLNGQARILDQYGKLPLSFEANHGQTDARVKFLSRTGEFSLFLTEDEAVLALSKKTKVNESRTSDSHHALPSVAAESEPGGVLRMKFHDSNPKVHITGVDQLAGTTNYFVGNDPAKWRTNVPTYTKVKYEGIYSGIDLIYYGNQRQLEYDFVVAPGADPRKIAFDVRGDRRIFRDAHGDLFFKLNAGDIRWHRPVVYQEKDGKRQLIAARYVVTDGNRVGFAVGKYDARRALYIDPLVYSTYLGGSGIDHGFGIAVDSAGNVYVAGQTASTDFPVTSGTFKTTYRGGLYDAFVTKINPSGSGLVYSTYLGGSDWDNANGLAVDGEGNAYVTGFTQSANFPVTRSAFQTKCNQGSNCDNGDGFVTKLNPAGSALVYSSYLGGSQLDYANGITVDSAGDVYITGYTYSTDFPVTRGAVQTACNDGDSDGCTQFGDAFVTKVNPAGSALVYSTYLGGNSEDVGWGIATDSAGNAYVTGHTISGDFPVTPGSFQQTCGDNCAYPISDVFVTKLNATGSALIYSTYLGGSNTDFGWAIAVDTAGNAYVAGQTRSYDFPTTPGAFRTVCDDGVQCIRGDAFVSKLNSAGSALVYSTYLGGTKLDLCYGIAVDSEGNAYVTGQTYSAKFPITPGAFQRTCNHGSGCAKDGDGFVSKLNSTGSALFYSTYAGGSGADYGYGIALDSAGNAYVTGATESTNFPTMNSLQPVSGGGPDAFVVKIAMLATPTTTLSSSPNPSTYGQTVTFNAAVTSSAGAPPDGETVSFMKGKTVLGTGTLSGGSASFSTSTLKVGTSSVKAVYGGDSNFSGSTSKTVRQVVIKTAD
jgi:Bacterial Ig-like domain (group 3)/Beta-propeller repeat